MTPPAIELTPYVIVVDIVSSVLYRVLTVVHTTGDNERSKGFPTRHNQLSEMQASENLYNATPFVVYARFMNFKSHRHLYRQEERA